MTSCLALVANNHNVLSSDPPPSLSTLGSDFESSPPGNSDFESVALAQMVATQTSSQSRSTLTKHHRSRSLKSQIAACQPYLIHSPQRRTLFQSIHIPQHRFISLLNRTLFQIRPSRIRLGVSPYRQTQTLSRFLCLMLRLGLWVDRSMLSENILSFGYSLYNRYSIVRRPQNRLIISNLIVYGARFSHTATIKTSRFWLNSSRTWMRAPNLVSLPMTSHKPPTYRISSELTLIWHGNSLASTEGKLYPLHWPASKLLQATKVISTLRSSSEWFELTNASSRRNNPTQSRLGGFGWPTGSLQRWIVGLWKL